MGLFVVSLWQLAVSTSMGSIRSSIEPEDSVVPIPSFT